MGPHPWIGSPIRSKRTVGVNPRKGSHPRGCSRSSPIQKCGPGSIIRCGVGRKPQLRPPRWPNSVRRQASVVGGESGSVCREAARERGSLRLVFVGCEAASSTTLESDPERVAAPAVG
jgi:hypothetical protein